MNIEEANEYIKKVSSLGSKPGLERITELLGKIGNPQNCLNIIHVAGTNGKGSFSAMLDSVLRKAGYSTGLFTSPHMIRYNERIKYNGRDISDGDISKYLTVIAEKASEMSDRPTEFELTTALGYLYFSDVRPDFCIVECGMGGRYDATNVISSPVLSVITGIALDHTAYLGDTVEKIASEKAGIIKEGRPVLFGGESDGAYEVIKREARAKNSRLYMTDRSKVRDIAYRNGSLSFSYGTRKNVTLSLKGMYQALNGANVIKAVDILRLQGLKIDLKSLSDGLAHTDWIGRFEKLSSNPDVYFDGGHNPDGVEMAVKTAGAYFGEKVILVTGVLKDKDYPRMTEMMSSVAEKVYTVSPDSPRALDSRSLANEFAGNGIDAEACDDYRSALDRAVKAAKDANKPVLCLGSLYSYQDIKPYFEEKKK